MKFTEKTQLNQFLSFPIISSSNESRGSASHWGMNTSGIGQCHMFSIFFSKCQKRNSRKRTKKNQFLSFQIISSPNEPRGRASHWGMNTSGIGQCKTFSIFSKYQKRNYRGKPTKKQFLSFPIISSSNEPWGRVSHWGMSTSGIGQCHIFLIFFPSVRNETYEKNPIKSIFEFSNYI